MGWATTWAVKRFGEAAETDEDERRMRAGVSVRNIGFNGFSWFCPKGSIFEVAEGGGKHVEEQCFDDVRAEYGGTGGNLPMNSIVVVYCRWSPCTRCTEATGAFVEGINAKRKGIQVKMLFDHFYCASVREAQGYKRNSGPTLWPSEDDAKAAYGTLMERFGTLTLKTSAEKGGTKSRNVLLIQQLDRSKLREGKPPLKLPPPAH
jgi:hypothetical protein